MADTETGVWLPPGGDGVRALVFQDARLFPHMSVATNLRFCMRRAQPGTVKFDEVVELLGIGARQLVGTRCREANGNGWQSGAPFWRNPICC